eukprot:1154350-Pelagomonas_calceolata.AAC.3
MQMCSGERGPLLSKQHCSARCTLEGVCAEFPHVDVKRSQVWWGISGSIASTDTSWNGCMLLPVQCPVWLAGLLGVDATFAGGEGGRIHSCDGEGTD